MELYQTEKDKKSKKNSLPPKKLDPIGKSATSKVNPLNKVKNFELPGDDMNSS